MKNLKSIFLLFCLVNFVSLNYAQEKEEKRQKSITTTVSFLNGNTYVKPINGHWLKINDGGFEEKQKPLQKNKHPNHKSGTDGKWVVSDFNKNYQFTHSRIPKKMANYKDSSVIVAGWQTQTDSAVSKIFINRTTNRGESWHRIYEETTASAQFNFYQLQHPSPSHIIAIADKFAKDSAGNYKTTFFLMTSTDTANSWSVNDSIFEIDDVPFSFDFEGKYGMIRLVKPDTTILLYSENYGKSWNKFKVPADLRYGFGRVLGKDSIFLASQSPNKKMGYTNNIKSGIWQFAPTPDTFNSVSTYIRNADTVWSVVPVPSGIGNSSRSFITGTRDGGQNWNTALNVFFEDSLTPMLGLNNIDFATKNYGAAMGTAQSYLTEDGGKTWENFDTLIIIGSQVLFYYYNPDTEKRLLMNLLNDDYVMKYEFEEPTGLAEKENIESQLKIYPNPAKNSLFLELPQGLVIKNGSVTVISIEGKEVANFNLSNNSNGLHEITIDNLSSGTYILQLKSSDYVGSKLFVKQ